MPHLFFILDEPFFMLFFIKTKENANKTKKITFSERKNSFIEGNVPNFQ